MCRGNPDLGGAVVHLHRAVGRRSAGQRQRVVVGDAVADHAAVVRERCDRGAAGAGVAVTILATTAADAALVLPAASVAVAVKLWLPSTGRRWCSSRRRCRWPCGAEQGGAVVDLHRAVGLGRAVSQRVVVGDAVATLLRRYAIAGAVGAAVSIVTVSAAEAALVLPAASVAVAVRLWLPFDSPGGVAPGAAAVGGHGAEQGGAVVDLDRAVGRRRAGQRQRVVIGDAVAGDAAVGRERRDRRGGRRSRVDRRHWRRRPQKPRWYCRPHRSPSP